jgi:enoyl-CoA hydratase/carnithine racemase
MTSIADSVRAASTPEALLTDVTDGVAVITINRPDVRNTVNRQVQLAVGAALEAFRHNDSVAVVVLAGAGAGSVPGPDKASGAAAFLAKGKPAFRGR